MYLSELFKKPDGLVKDAVHVPMTVSRLQIIICTWTLGVGPPQESISCSVEAILSFDPHIGHGSHVVTSFY